MYRVYVPMAGIYQVMLNGKNWKCFWEYPRTLLTPSDTEVQTLAAKLPLPRTDGFSVRCVKDN